MTSGFWVGAISYEFGASIEGIRSPTDRLMDIPSLYFTHFEDFARISLDLKRVSGSPNAIEQGLAFLEPTMSEVVETQWQTSIERDDYCAKVEQVRELLAAGQCYQINLTRQIYTRDPVGHESLFYSLISQSPASHAAHIPLGDTVLVSASPETFLRWNHRDIVTRPIKGTASLAEEVLTEKNLAENLMIVDLARNDLGKVCEYGSIDAPRLYGVEEHPGLLHMVSEVTGTLRDDSDLPQIIEATCPPASITGAPKPRVMRAIAELEPTARGWYCGAHGWIDMDNFSGSLAVTIRSFTCAQNFTTLGVGAGIVYDSVPELEWEETELKAARLLQAAGAFAGAHI